MPKDVHIIERFIAQDPDRARVRDVVEAAGFSIERVLSPVAERSWGFVLRAGPKLQELFGRRMEVLLWSSGDRTFQARTIQEARRHIETYRPRLSEDFAIILSAAASAEKDVAVATERLDTVFIGIPFHLLSTLAPFGSDTLTAILQARVYSRDLYQLTGAVTDPHRFFGRRTLISEIAAALRGRSHVGLFGLRKMGKTSLLYRILDELRARPSILTAHVDVQRIDAVERSASYFLWSLGEALFDANKSIQTNTKLRLFGEHAMFLDVPSDVRANIAQYFHHDIRCVLETRDRRIIFLLDEIERMWPGPKLDKSVASGWGMAFVQVWRLLRGIEQEFAGRISFFVTGTSPECVEASQAAGEENPLHRYVERRFLPHLDEESRRELLTHIGGAIGIGWSEEALRFVVAQVSGHPSLLRTVGSFVHRWFARRTGPVRVDGAAMREIFESALPELNASLRQITEALRESYPDDFMLLDMLANGRVGEYRELAAIAPEALEHLRGHELVDTAAERLTQEALETLLQKQGREVKQTQTRPELEAGDIFEGYTVLQHISSGGFGAVYKVTAADGRIAALKVFLPNMSSFEFLLREVEPLQQIKHANVLRILDYNKTADARVYLVTEFLEGNSLERHCVRSFRHTDAEAAEVLRVLLGALASFHPNVKRLEELRQLDDLSSEEAEELSRVRAGYIHRDITPSNVIVTRERGPVLIDFGIASKIASPVMTVSCKPGYLPPDFNRTRWSPDVDLYQLGVTVTQTRLGAQLDGTEESVTDLRSRLALEPDVGSRLRGVLMKMTAPERGDRFDAAEGVMSALG